MRFKRKSTLQHQDTAMPFERTILLTLAVNFGIGRLPHANAWSLMVGSIEFGFTVHSVLDRYRYVQEDHSPKS